MALLLNEDFSTYQLRLAYLTHIHDGVGERLINLNTSILNNPAFRAAGWLPDTAAQKRCYSPPIPTTGAGVRSEYFQAPRKHANRDRDGGGVSLHEEGGGGGEGGMVSGQAGSEDTIGAIGGLGTRERRRRQRTRKEQLEEEDSSDLESEDSDEDDGSKTAAQGITFNKMPMRDRAKSTPANPLREELEKDDEGGGPALMITSPSRPPDAVGLGLRRGSLGSQVEAVKQRARRDTTTSSDMSSENELDPNAFARKLPGRPGGRKTVLLAERIQEEEDQHRELGTDREGDGTGGESDLEDEDVGEASDLSDEFEVDDGTVDSPSMLGMASGMARASDTSPAKPPPNVPPAVPANHHIGTSSRKEGEEENLLTKPLPKLPPGRPISAIPPPSLLSMALKGTNGVPGGAGEKPFQRFADLSGKGEANPLWIKIYAPFSETPTDPIEVSIRRQREGQPVTVSDLIGLALWRYNEEGYKPPVEKVEETSINRWTLRIVEDEEVDFDFEALLRTRPVTDFTSNNNRPPQRRARDKPWDEFGLVRATEDQFKENEELTPQIGTTTTPSIPPPPSSATTPAPTPKPASNPEPPQLRPPPTQRTESEVSTTRSFPTSFNPARGNPITGPSFAPSALRKETGASALDLPQQSESTSTPRTGAPKTVTLHYTDPQSFATSKVIVDTTADTYLAEIFDEGCKKLGLDKGLHVLKVHATQIVAPADRTVEALGEKLKLDLVRRRFIGAAGGGDGVFGLGLSGSPGSAGSPNAPLEVAGITTPNVGGGKYGKRGKGPGAAGGGGIYKTDATSTLNLGLGLGIENIGKRYNVLRKQPLSFAPSHPRTLIITPEYMQILPAAPDSLAAPTGKVTNVPMTSIIGVKVSRKHPKMVRVLVFRERETKRYDFECATRGEAESIVSDVRKGLDGLGDGDGEGGGEA